MTVPKENEAKPHFRLPKIEQNTDGWGPHSLPTQFNDVPFAPFSKSDKLGKIADWTVPLPGQDVHYDRKNRDRYPRAESYGMGLANAFGYQHSVEEEASFSLVDRGTTSTKKTGFASRSRMSRANPGRGASRGGAAFSGRGGRGGRGGGQFGPRRRWDNKQPQRIRDASVQVGSEWKIVEEIEFNRLSKLVYDVDEPIDIAAHGRLNYYDKNFDRISTRSEKTLQQIDRVFHNITTSDDPIIQKIAKETEGPTVFATDNIIATLMCAPRSVYSWDIVIQKWGNKLFFDKREGGTFDFVTVNENATDAPVDGGEKDTLNGASSLAIEGTYVVRNYSQQVLKENENYSLKDPNPFYDPAIETDPLASVGYRYRKWDLGDDVELVVRTQIDAALHSPGPSSQNELSEVVTPIDSTYPVSETLLITVKALNEFDPKAPGAGGAPDWRQKLDTQRGAVVATEIKNNGNKLARWTVESILSGVDQLRIGFVSRANPKDRNKHAILGAGFFKPREFAAQMNYNISNGWGILKTFVDLCMSKLEDGKYVLVKDPNKPVLRLYSVPINTFDEEEEEEGEEEEVVGQEENEE